MVLRDVDMRLEAGTPCGIVGENGAGKSTLLKILSGELRPARGAVRHGGRFGYCPQHVVLNDALTVRQHSSSSARLYRLADLGYAEELMDVLGVCRLRRRAAGALSGGTRQKLNVTLALMHDPQVLLLDEPYQGSRLGHLPAILGPGRATAGCGTLRAGRLPPGVRHRAPGRAVALGGRDSASGPGGGRVRFHLTRFALATGFTLTEHGRNRFAMVLVILFVPLWTTLAYLAMPDAPAPLQLHATGERLAPVATSRPRSAARSTRSP